MKTGTPTEFWLSPEGQEALVVLEMVFWDVARREACDHPRAEDIECLNCGVER